MSIGNETMVPIWAYQNVSQGNTFNATLAKNLARAAPSATWSSVAVVFTGNHNVGVTTTQTTTSAEETTTASTLSPPSITPGELDVKHVSFPLWDVLGLILGVVVVVCMGVLWLLYRRRLRRRRAPSSMFEGLKKLEKPTVADRLVGTNFAYSPLDADEIHKNLAGKNISRLSLPSELYDPSQDGPYSPADASSELHSHLRHGVRAQAEDEPNKVEKRENHPASAEAGTIEEPRLRSFTIP